MRVLCIDNFDSFTYNLVDEFAKKGCDVQVYRNNIDMSTFDKIIKKFKPQLMVISPGPGTPENAGNCINLIHEYAGKIPMFGICLGMQCIVEAFDGRVTKAPETIHGKPTSVKHDGETIFKGLPNPFQAGRYHSLHAHEVPYILEISARSETALVMAVRHKEMPIEGVQFHPESVLTTSGSQIMENVMKELKK